MQEQVGKTPRRERVYESVIAFRASQSLVKALKERAKELGLNPSDFLRMKLVEILQEKTGNKVER
jgi:antitoxin component of RelBE/YafQ-DinJ toxin-antitoxin module